MLKLLFEEDKRGTGEAAARFILSRLPSKCVNIKNNGNYTVMSVMPSKGVRGYSRPSAVLRKTAQATAGFALTHMAHVFAMEKIISAGLPNDECERLCRKIRMQIIGEINSALKRHRGNNWYTALIRRILYNMGQSDIFAVNSFLRFRLEDYKGYVYQHTLSAMRQYNAEHKYMEFIESLQCFVESRKSSMEEIIINADESGYCLTDGNSEPIDISVYRQAREDDVDNEDLVMGILLAVTPKRIRINADDGFYNSEFFASLTNIFGERIIH